MGPEEVSDSYDAGGYCEQPEAKHLNKALLGVDHDKWLRTYPRQDLCRNGDIEKRARAIIDANQTAYADWGFKDPRTVLTYTFWAELLPAHKVIAVYRDPMSLWQRTRRGAGPKWHQDPLRAVQMLSRWLDHNVRLRDIVANDPERCLLLRYERLMDTSRELARLSAFLGREVADRRDSGLWRGKHTETPLLRLARPIAERRNGHRVDRLLQDLDRLREQQLH